MKPSESLLSFASASSFAQGNHALAYVYACDNRSLVAFLPEIENEDPSLVVLCEDGSFYK